MSKSKLSLVNHVLMMILLASLGLNLPAQTVQGFGAVDNLPLELSSPSQPQRQRVDWLVEFSDQHLTQWLKARQGGISEAEFQAAYSEYVAHGHVLGFGEKYLAIARIRGELIPRAAKLPSEDEEGIATLFREAEEAAAGFPDVALTREEFEEEVEFFRENSISAGVFPATEQELMEEQRPFVEKLLVHFRTADMQIALLQLDKSEKIKTEFETWAWSYPLGSSKEEKFLGWLRIREWNRYKYLMIRDHVVVDDPELQEALVKYCDERLAEVGPWKEPFSEE
ncbi:MAG: hypothetical protein SF028_13640 [Candidatus Sumerlaeia bacterium]|nr:hypothetical protein [Candidatus Sumerlaeia bacterium]